MYVMIEGSKLRVCNLASNRARASPRTFSLLLELVAASEQQPHLSHHRHFTLAWQCTLPPGANILLRQAALTRFHRQRMRASVTETVPPSFISNLGYTKRPNESADVNIRLNDLQNRADGRGSVNVVLYPLTTQLGVVGAVMHPD